MSVRLFGEVTLHLLLLLLPIAACALLAVRFGITNQVLLIMCALAGSGLLGYVTFWVYLLSSALGRVVAVAVAVACAAVLLDGCRRRFAKWRELAVFAPVTALFCAAGWFYLALGYLYGGTTGAGEVTANRFRPGLPGDSYIPILFAHQLQHARRPLPNLIMADFQSSDRPPLQTGFYLMQQALLGNGHFIDYQIMGTLVQSFWIFALWAFFQAARQARWATSLCLAAVLFNGFTIQNSFFTWPKLIAGAFLVLSAAILLTPELRASRGSRTAGALTGVTLGCSMLGHTGSVFVLASILLTLLVFRALPTLRFLLYGGAALIATYLPWSLYGKYYQPPANALTLLQLANSGPTKPGQTTSSVIIDAYRKLTTHQILDDKLSNFTTPLDHTVDFLRTSANLLVHAFSPMTPAATAQGHLEVVWLFFYLGPVLGLIGWGLLIPFVRAGWDGYSRRVLRRPAPARTGGWSNIMRLGLLNLTIAYVIWCLTLLGPNATIVHQGSYFLELMALGLGVMAWWSFSRRATFVIVALSCAVALDLYIRFTPFALGRGTPFDSNASPAAVMLLTTSILACLACLWWVATSTRASLSVESLIADGVPNQADVARSVRVAYEP